MPPRKTRAAAGGSRKASVASSPSPPPPSLPPAPTGGATTSFLSFRVAFKRTLSSLSDDLALRRAAGAIDALSKEEQDDRVQRIIDSLAQEHTLATATPDPAEPWRTDTRRQIIDKALDEQLLDITFKDSLGVQEQYGLLGDMLDIILTFSERDYADASLPMQTLLNVVELQSIEGCHHIFNYIESRRDRLTLGMHPQKGKGPLLLRLLNELLRRLPKSKSDDVIFSGRILMFLSSVFPLGEKSGVNLRGNFNLGKVTTWEDPIVPGVVGEEVKSEEEDEAKMVVEEEPPVVGEEDPEAVKEEDTKDPEPMQEDSKPTPPAPEPDFYATFWSLQTFFNNPPLLFTAPPSSSSDPSTPAQKDQFEALQAALIATLDSFAAATKKERELAGGAANHDVKPLEAPGEGARDQELEHYFFPKFLTSRNLLELEIADPAFRRQILVQVLVLFQILLGFTPEGRKAALALPTTNHPAALNPHVVGPDTEKWIRELRARALSEMGAMQDGPRFRHTVELILMREQNWINWKLTSCAPFTKDPIDPTTISTLAGKKLDILSRKPKAFPYQMGNHRLANLWAKDTSSAAVPPEKSLDAVVAEWTVLKNKIEELTRERQVVDANEANLTSASLAERLSSIDNSLENLKIRANALHWHAARLGAGRHLKFINKTKVDDLGALLVAVHAPPTAPGSLKAESSMMDSPAPSVVGAVEEEDEVKEGVEEKEGEQVKKMEAPQTPKRAREDDEDDEMASVGGGAEQGTPMKRAKTEDEATAIVAAEPEA
ncbi:hypothetical protein RQP46_005366 [Phenoliferia psychrophenolica]